MPLLPESIVDGVTTGHVAHTQQVHKKLNGYYDLVQDLGGVADARFVTASLTGTTLTGSGFLASDVGKSVVVPGAGVGGVGLTTTVASYTSASSMTLSASATANVTSKVVTIGTNNSPMIQAFFTAVPTGLTNGPVGHTLSIPRGRYLIATTVDGKAGTRVLGAGTVTGTEGVYDANGSVLMCGVPNGVSMRFLESTSIAQTGVDVERLVFWDVTNGGGEATGTAAAAAANRGSTTCLSLKNINRWNVDRCSFVMAKIGLLVDYFKADNTTIGDAAWWYCFRSRFASCETGIDLRPGGSGLIEGGDWTGCDVGIYLAPEAVPTRIHGIKMDVPEGKVGIRGRSFLTTISQCAFECVNAVGNQCIALDLNGDAAQFYYGTGVSVSQCTFFTRGPANTRIILGSTLKRANFFGNFYFYVTIENTSVNLTQNDTADTGSGSIVALRSQPA